MSLQGDSFNSNGLSVHAENVYLILIQTCIENN